MIDTIESLQMEVTLSSLTAPPYYSLNNSNQDQLHKTIQTAASATNRHFSDPLPGPYFCSTTEKWAAKLLHDCARAISDNNSISSTHFLWMLNELASPYGDLDQKLAFHFSRALFYKATDSGRRCYETLSFAADTRRSFDSETNSILKFQEVSPWLSFGHVACNGAILEAFEKESNLHVIDLSNTLCTQWPMFLESLATRNDDETPRLKLTVIGVVGGGGSVLMEVGRKMERFARLMRVPFEFRVASELTKEGLGVREDEAIAVNCVGGLRGVEAEKRDEVIHLFRSIQPRVVTVVEEEADLTRNDGFLERFDECLRFYSLYFEMLEESFEATSSERLEMERDCSRSIIRVLACDDNDEMSRRGFAGGGERRERGRQWCERFREGFSSVAFSRDVVDDVEALLKRYRAGWGVSAAAATVPEEGGGPGMYLTWKEEPAVWASAWKPYNRI